MEKGDRVIVIEHYRCKGVVGGWEAVFRPGTVLKVNDATCWVKMDFYKWPTKVRKENIRRD